MVGASVAGRDHRPVLPSRLVALAIVLISAGGVLWLLTLVGLIRDRRSALWNRILVGVLLAVLPPAAAIYWWHR